MKKLISRWEKGFTLIEIMLVMVIISVILYMSMGYLQQQTRNVKIDKSSAQMQQILNAGLAYYVNNGEWPAGGDSLACLQGTGAAGCLTSYLPVTMNNPFGGVYSAAISNTNFSVSLAIPASLNVTGKAVAKMIAGRLPLASVDASGLVVTSYINIPAQSLNNSTSINFAGLYHQGACVPAPICPADQNGNPMEPKVIVTPVSVSGLNDPSPSTNVYPISSFSSYATALTADSGSPPACENATNSPACPTVNTGASYWRVCLQVISEYGDVSKTNPGWGEHVTVAAFTRCAPTNEVSGSDFSVYGN